MALRGGEEQPLAPVGGAGPALDEILLDQLLEHPVEALLGDAQDVEELGDGQARLAVDEMQDAVMGAPETVLVQDPVGIADEVAIGEEEQLDQVVGRLLGQDIPAGLLRPQSRECVRHHPYPKFYVSLVDISQDDCYSSSRFREMNEIEIAWKRTGNYTTPVATRSACKEN